MSSALDQKVVDLRYWEGLGLMVTALPLVLPAILFLAETPLVSAKVYLAIAGLLLLAPKLRSDSAVHASRTSLGAIRRSRPRLAGRSVWASAIPIARRCGTT